MEALRDNEGREERGMLRVLLQEARTCGVGGNIPVPALSL